MTVWSTRRTRLVCKPWSCVDDAMLDAVFKNCENCDPETRAQAQHLIRWCLQGNASDRPKILRHPFLSQSFGMTKNTEDDEEEEKEEETMKKRPQPKHKFQILAKLPVMNMRYHFFVSHMQVEAAVTWVRSVTHCRNS